MDANMMVVEFNGTADAKVALATEAPVVHCECCGYLWTLAEFEAGAEHLCQEGK